MTDNVISSASASTPAQLPAIPRTGIPEVDRAIDAIRERLEVREGARGNPWERVVTVRDLRGAGLSIQGMSGAGSMSPGSIVSVGTAPGTVMIAKPGGGYASASFEVFAQALKQTGVWKALQKQVSDPKRFDGLPDKVRELLQADLLAEAATRGADIQRLEQQIQSSRESFAAQRTQITAAIGQLAAGVQRSEYAFADQNRATAGAVTSVTARLDGFGGGTASVEEVMTALADRATGLEAQWTLKVNAGGAFAAIGVGATSPTAGPSDSHIIFVADNFAFVKPTDVIGTGPGEVDPTNPGASRIPFGIDSDGTIYLNGTVRINTGGTAVQDIANFQYIGAFSSPPSTAGLKKNNVYLNTTDGNTYILTADAGSWSLWIAKGTNGINGINGTNGTNGTRGSVTAYASGSSWSDSTAASAIATYTGTGYLVIGDTVTISNGSSFAATKYWGGSSWLAPGVVIDGNLLVNGTLSADKINGGTITASDLYIHGGDFQVVASTGACVAYTFTGVGSNFVNGSNPSLTPLTATSTHNTLGATKPAIKAVAGSGGNAIETTGDISVSGVVTATQFNGALNGNATSANSASTAGSASTASTASTASQVSNASGAALICGTYRTTMQSDGNLVLTSGGTPVWDAFGDNVRDCDRRWKKNIRDTVVSGGAVVELLRVRDFKLRRSYLRWDPWQHTGLIADEVREVVPEAVTEGPDGMLRLNESRLVPHLVKALQEQALEIRRLNARLDAFLQQQAVA